MNKEFIKRFRNQQKDVERAFKKVTVAEKHYELEVNRLGKLKEKCDHTGVEIKGNYCGLCGSWLGFP